MANQSLAVKYRPQTFSDVVEQGSIRKILERQLKTGEIKHAYLFCGGAGTGKTTCARLFANEINEGKGSPVEMDAASNNSVEDARAIITQSKTSTLDGSKYRVYIIDECHMLSNSAWNAMLKLLEEPPATAIFIFCTTDPQKIPKTILSRVQRYDFQRISQLGIETRLMWILDAEGIESETLEAIQYIAKIADGGMRDAITMLDKCLAYSNELTLENVVEALGAVDYEVMLQLTDDLVYNNVKSMIECIEGLHRQGKDIKLFIRSYCNFVLDLCKYSVMGSLEFTQLPEYYSDRIKDKEQAYFERCQSLLTVLLHLSSDIKWDSNPKAMVEANLYGFCLGGE